MKFFNNLYASSYRIYQEYNDGGRFSSICVVAIALGTLILLVLVLVEKAFGVSLLVRINGVYYNFLGLTVIIGLAIYYSKKRTTLIVEEFEKKSIQERKLWGVVTILSVVLPTLIIAFLLHKPSVV